MMTRSRLIALALWLAWPIPAAAQDAFVQAGSLPDAYMAHSMAAWGGRLYHLGGIGGANGVFDGDKVYFAPVTGPGRVGPWTPGPSLPARVFYHASAVWNGTLYVIGGYNYTDGFVVSNAVYYSRIQADGTPGEWKRAADLPTSLYLHSAAVWNGTLFVTGGWGDSGLTNGVYGGAIQADGSIGSWTPLRPLPTGIYAHTTVQDGTLYVIGGAVDNGTRVHNEVYFAPILADKSLGPWQEGSPLPQPLASHTSEVIRGRIWVAGGWTGSDPTAWVVSAPILADKSIGAWTRGPSLPLALYQQASAVVDDVLYVSGGLDGSNTYSDVWALPPQPTPPPADRLPPRTTLALEGPSDGVDPVFVSAQTSFALAATDDRSSTGDAAGTVAVTQWSEDDRPFAAYGGAFRLSDEGGHWLRYYSVDAAGNAEAAHALAVAVDATAPVSDLSVGAPQAALDGALVVSSGTLLSVAAYDPASAGTASGVAETLVGIDGSAPAPAAVPFALPPADGPHAIAYQSADRVGNREVLRATTIYVDATPPQTTATASAGPFAAPDGPVWPAGLLVRLDAEDPAPHGAAAGVHHVEFSMDGAAAATGAEVAVDEGIHALAFRAVDNVGNAEPWRQAGYRVDATPPATSLSLGSPVLDLFGREFATPETPFTLQAEDPTSAGVASGVRSIYYRVDDGPEQLYGGTFRLAAGAHVLHYHAVDNAGNAEPEQAVDVQVGSLLSDAAAATGDAALSGGASITGNVRAGGAFSAGGRSSVSGDVTAASISLSGRSTISGRASEAPNAIARLDVAWARAYAERQNDNASVPGLTDPLSLNGHAALTLPAGTYFLHGLTLSGQATLSASGKVQIFIAGPVSVTGGAAFNDAGSADDAWVFSDGDQVTVAGHGRTAMNLVAPRAAVSFSGGGQVAGRILAGSLSLSGHAARPSDTVLPPRARPGRRSGTLPKAQARAGSRGTDGKAGGRSATVRSARLEYAAPVEVARGERRAPAAAPAPQGPAASGTGSAVSTPRKVTNSMPPLLASPGAAMTVVTPQGHAVRSAARHGVVVPEGALRAALALSVAVESRVAPEEAERRARAADRRTLTALGNPVSYGPEGTRFARPVTLELAYDRSRLPAGASEDKLAVHYWNPRSGEWEPLASTVDKQSQVVRANTEHFSTYQVMAGAGTAAGSGSSGLLGEVFAYPNPAGQGRTPKLRINSSAESVEIRIFDIAGELKHSATLDHPAAVVDHAWDAAGVGSGVYLYVVIARRAGEAPAKATGKIALIK